MYSFMNMYICIEFIHMNSIHMYINVFNEYHGGPKENGKIMY